MSSRFGWVCCLSAVALLAACQPPASTTVPATNAEGEPTGLSLPGGEKPTGATSRGLQVRPELKSLAGHWGLVITQAIPDRNGQPMPRDLCLSLISLKEGGTDGWSGEILATLEGTNPLTLKAVRVEATNLELDLTMADAALMFRGRLTDGVVRGTLTLPGAGLVPAMLRPTNETKFEGWDPAPVASGVERLSKGMSDKNQPQATLDAAAELRGNALSMNAYESVIGRLAQFPSIDEPTIRTIVKDYLSAAEIWGPQLVTQAKLNAAVGVAVYRKTPDLAQELIKSAEQAEDLSADWKENLRFAQEQASLDLGLRGLKSKDTAVQQAAFDSLSKLLSSQRYNPELLDALAIYAEKSDQKPLAKQYFAEIVSLPLLEGMWQQGRAGQPPGDPTPRERLLKLWEDEHGNLDGFDQFLTETHKRRIAELQEQALQAGPTAIPQDEQQRTVVVELFTGGACPPCVASDLSLGVLSQAYAKTQVVALQYHQHIPGPDPLANLDAEDRFTYYEGQGTPTLAVDGRPLPGIPGMLQHVDRVYRIVRTAVDARLKVPAAAKVTLTAKVAGEELVVEAAASDFPADEDQASKIRLRLALASDHVDYNAPNGIRHHELVVRKLLGGAKGVGVKSGRLTYSLTMPLADIKEELSDYLGQFESGRNYTFLVKPLDLKGLTLVGWVQNDETREILGSAVIPVEGGADSPPAESK